MNAPQSKSEVPSFEEVYERYFDFVWSMTRRFGVPPAQLDDVVQEVFIVVHGKLHTVRQPESLRSWLYGIARRTALHQRREQGAEMTELDETLVASATDQVEQNARVRRLWALLAQLEPVKREVFIMAELEEFTCPEIAEALEIPLNTAYSRLRAAKEAFEAALLREDIRDRRLT